MEMKVNPGLLKMVLPLAEKAQNEGLVDGIIDEKLLGNARFFINSKPNFVIAVFDENSYSDIPFPINLSGKKIFIGNN